MIALNIFLAVMAAFFGFGSVGDRVQKNRDIVNALEKVNDDNNSYADLKKEVIAAKDAVDKDVDAVQQKYSMIQDFVQDIK